ncbi:uncharacterized protein MAM_03458 [Metarhizium album ARSEF 1941]|uniref:Zn(II)2Cys6 transcription factor n=1 Tax=Metarhizium album (strain ARSEF 1941) TaxID=1081103 RepID=A0A0B2WSE6_METAS|nr:uncharacterized protein MAM_03458 [Metarhizium album ARSEF 1941]KHN98996.1 hypothetical protein MAM_03458 [Metarhizium album ARSEF 1941]
MFSALYDSKSPSSGRTNSRESRGKHVSVRHFSFGKDSGLASSRHRCGQHGASPIRAATDSPTCQMHALQTSSRSGELQIRSPIQDDFAVQESSRTTSQCHSFEPCLSIPRLLLPDQDSLGMASDLSSISSENLGSVNTPVTPALSSQAGLSGNNGTLRSFRHAELLRFYREHWASGLDSQDDGRHFTIHVPQLALNTPILLNAIFAVTSLHQSRLLGSSPSVAEQYHGKCVKLLLHMLEHEHAPMDDVLLATTVILRVYEQMNGSFGDNECHLLGASAIAATQSSASGSLWKAAFWIYLRQDIYMAILDHRPVRIDLSRCWLWREPQPRNDAQWSQLIMLIVAEITRFCFSQPTARRAEKWQELREQVDEWRRLRPQSFHPYYFAERNVEMGRYFPEIWLSEQWHVTANIYYEIGQSLLLIYDPEPVIGIAARRHHNIVQVATPPKHAQRRPSAYIASSQARMVDRARRICGICLSNPTPETRRTCCYAIHLCCPYISNQKEQRLVVQILKDTEAKLAWPTESIVQALKEEWEPISQLEDKNRGFIDT